MKHIRRKSTLLLLTIAIVVGSLSSSAYALGQSPDPVSDGYQYLITPESDDWFNYSVTEKVAMLQIPEETLSAMSNDELIEALAAYPYLVDIYLYGCSVHDGVEVVKTYCSALNELLKRDPELTSLGNYLSTNSAAYLASTDAEAPFNFEYNALTEIFIAVSNETANTALCFGNVITTPKNTTVQVDTVIERHTSSQHAALDAMQLKEVYNAELIQTGSCLYNCHYFAWYMNGSFAENSLKCMPNPSAYMEDGSYTRTYTGNKNAPHCATNIRNGDIIFYGSTNNLYYTHSAICTNTSITTSAIRSLHCISKWGICGVFSHYLDSVPAGYDTSNISAWRLS